MYAPFLKMVKWSAHPFSSRKYMTHSAMIFLYMIKIQNIYKKNILLPHVSRSYTTSLSILDKVQKANSVFPTHATLQVYNCSNTISIANLQMGSILHPKEAHIARIRYNTSQVSNQPHFPILPCSFFTRLKQK